MYKKLAKRYLERAIEPDQKRGKRD